MLYMNQYLIFQLNGQKFALPVHIIKRVVRVVAVRPLAFGGHFGHDHPWEKLDKADLFTG